MSDLISRSALLEDMQKELEKAVNEDLQEDECKAILTSAIALKSFVNRQPTVDAVPVVHGEWIKKVRNNGGYIASITCSACGCSWHRSTYNFCPECGADMRKGGANNV